jgi:glycosyltransferase involved in cell wall biosynthesis
MKILMVVASYSPSSGGPTTVIRALASELVKKGHEVSIYTSDYFDKSSRVQEYSKPVEIDGIKVYYFKNISNKLAHNYNVYLSPMLVKKAKDNLKNFDIIHIHGFRTFQSIFIHHYAKKYNVPYILQTHGTVLPFFQKQSLKKIFDLFLGYKILRDVSKVIALTKTEAEQYKKMGGDENKIEIVPNGIDLSEYENLPEKGEFRRKYSIRDDEKIILYLGRIHKIKGIDLLVKAFADLVEELDNVKLVIVGPDGGFLSMLKRQIESLKIGDRILFTGTLYERDKLEAYVDADVYVLPSVYEIFPITVLEACACGTPVIVTDRCSIADFVNKIGYVVEYDKEQLQDAIIKVLSDEGLRRRFGERGKKLVEERLFSWDNIEKKVEGLYEDCIKGRIK